MLDHYKAMSFAIHATTKQAKILSSASELWPRPRPQTFGLGLASISLSYYVIRHFSGKSRVKFGNLLIFPAIS